MPCHAQNPATLQAQHVAPKEKINPVDRSGNRQPKTSDEPSQESRSCYVMKTGSS